MALHRRIPKKNRKKLKSVDPFNMKANAAKFNDPKRSRNNAPEKIKEEQPLTNAMKQLMAEHNPIITKQEAKKKKKQRNAVLRQSEELGLKKGRFETVSRFAKRIEGTLHSRISETIAIAKHGLAGRKQEEIDADYAKIDEAEKRKKDQAKREIENKIKEAKKKREQEAKKREEAEKAKELRKAAKRKLEEEEKKNEESFGEEEDEDDDDTDKRKQKKVKTTEIEEKKDEKIVKLSKKGEKKRNFEGEKDG
uniref:Uncharacterized protein n=1 Tax=Caenorhabditis japonica TaxID=281687 RepID=A0A8R1I0L6_CAEJA